MQEVYIINPFTSMQTVLLIKQANWLTLVHTQVSVMDIDWEMLMGIIIFQLLGNY